MGFVPTHASSCRTLTVPVCCRRCAADIWWFSCSCGSSTLFDQLGGAWPEHDCERTEAEAGLARARKIIEDGHDPKTGSHRPFEGLDGRVDLDALSPGDKEQIDQLKREASEPVTLRPEHTIKRMDPTAEAEEHFFIGFLRERASGTASIKALYAEIGGVGIKMLGLPAQKDALQLTIIDASGEPNESYTAIADRGLLEGGAQPGKLVGVSLVGRSGSGYRFWLVTDFHVL